MLRDTELRITPEPPRGPALVKLIMTYIGLLALLCFLQDIRNQRRHRQQRHRELLKLRQTLEGLDAKTLFYEEQIDYYNQYIKTCLDNLAASNKCGSLPKISNLKKTKHFLFSLLSGYCEC